MDKYICKIATVDEMEKKWDYEISIHPNDNNWQIWKNQTIEHVKNGKKICYYGILNDIIITEATAIIDKSCVQNGEDLVDDKTVYLSAFRTIKEYQSMGYFSKLYRFMENDLIKRGYEKATIGVEPTEIKNKKIYSKWGYNNYIKTAYEYSPDGTKTEVEYYLKKLIS